MPTLHESPTMLFAGRCVPALAQRIADEAQEFGGLRDVTLRNFSDGEIYVRYEESIRGTDLFIIQSTPPPAEHWMELFLMVDAARRAASTMRSNSIQWSAGGGVDWMRKTSAPRIDSS